MIVRCPDCRSKYEITRPKDLEALVKVRCPRCKAVFPVRRGEGDERAAGERRLRADSSRPVLDTAWVARPVGTAEARASRSRITDPALARRMARAMVSEIVLSREDDRKEGRRTETLLSRFGPAIVAAYEIYGRKVSSNLPAFRQIFRDAVNDVLGGGRKLL